jgi:hypothetical protein
MRVLLGPILLVLDVVPENQAWGVGLCVVLLPCLLAVFLRPRWWAAAMSVLAALVWLFLGVIADGIQC